MAQYATETHGKSQCKKDSREPELMPRRRDAHVPAD